MIRDLRQAVRMLLQSKGWTSVVLLSLALGIGVNTTLFSAVNGLLLRSLSGHEPDQLVRLRWAGENQMGRNFSSYGYTGRNSSGQRLGPTFSYPIFERLKESNETLSAMAACAPIGSVNAIVDGNAELAYAYMSTGGFFEVLGVPAFIGRTIQPSDDDPGSPPVAMISFGYWDRRFGADPAVLGTSITVNGTPVTIVGVTPQDYAGIQRLGGSASDIHLPLALNPQINQNERLQEATDWWLQIVGRLKPGVRTEQVQGNLDGVFQAAARAGMDSYLAGLSEEQLSLSHNQGGTAVPALQVSSARRGLYEVNPHSARSISVLSAVVVLVLLIVCANVANLLLSRAALRQKEISIRFSMGATRKRLIRQLLTESVLLSGLGGVLAIVVAFWSRQLLPAGQDSPLDWTVFAFAGGLSMLTGLAFGVIPAFGATRLDLASSLKATSRSLSRSRTIMGKSLLVLQVAVSLVLLVGAGLFLRTLSNLRSVEVGFNTQHLLLVPVDPSVNRYDREQSQILSDQMKEAFQAIPGVRSVSVTRTALLSGSTWTNSIYVQGREAGDEEPLDAHTMIVSPDFLETLEIPLLMGRNLTLQDNSEAPKVALINESCAKECFGDANPLGRRFGFSKENSGGYEVIGVIRDTKYSSVRDAPPPTVYWSILQRPPSRMTFVLRTAVDAESVIPSVREAARRVDSDLPLGSISTQAQLVEERLSQERLFANAYALFGGLALLLACIGLFGLMSYNVARRTNEIGIRMALGARRQGVVRMVLKESMILVAIGSVIGLAVAAAFGQLIESQLYGLAPTDPMSIAAAVLVMVLVSGIAGYLPARRASRLDPTIALHHE